MSGRLLFRAFTLGVGVNVVAAGIHGGSLWHSAAGGLLLGAYLLASEER